MSIQNFNNPLAGYMEEWYFQRTSAFSIFIWAIESGLMILETLSMLDFRTVDLLNTSSKHVRGGIEMQHMTCCFLPRDGLALERVVMQRNWTDMGGSTARHGMLTLSSISADARSLSLSRQRYNSDDEKKSRFFFFARKRSRSIMVCRSSCQHRCGAGLQHQEWRQ